MLPQFDPLFLSNLINTHIRARGCCSCFAHRHRQHYNNISSKSNATISMVATASLQLAEPHSTSSKEGYVVGGRLLLLLLRLLFWLLPQQYLFFHTTHILGAQEFSWLKCNMYLGLPVIAKEELSQHATFYRARINKFKLPGTEWRFSNQRNRTDNYKKYYPDHP